MNIGTGSCLDLAYNTKTKGNTTIGSLHSINKDRNKPEKGSSKGNNALRD